MLVTLMEKDLMLEAGENLERKVWKRCDNYYEVSTSSDRFTTASSSKVENLQSDNRQQHLLDYDDKIYYQRNSHSYAGIITAIAAVILVIGAVLYRLIKKLDLLYAQRPESPVNLEPACEHPTCGQYCTLVANNSGENVSIDISTIATLSQEHSPSQHTRTSSCCNDAHTFLDLPPSYNTSLNYFNGTYESPPSYSEALINTSLRSTNNK